MHSFRQHPRILYTILAKLWKPQYYCALHCEDIMPHHFFKCENIDRIIFMDGVPDDDPPVYDQRTISKP